MKTLQKMLAVLFVFTICQSSNAQSNKSGRVKSQEDSIKIVQYACPMHPEVTSDKPGKCSRCGMDLNLSKKEQMKQEAVKYTCPMHPEIASEKPGKCSKCGMNLNLSKKEQMKMDVVNGYTCPMHPDITADKPGKCPKCGMDLAKTKPKG